jgi:hypothetical protein
MRETPLDFVTGFLTESDDKMKFATLHFATEHNPPT